MPFILHTRLREKNNYGDIFPHGHFLQAFLPFGLNHNIDGPLWFKHFRG